MTAYEAEENENKKLRIFSQTTKITATASFCLTRKAALTFSQISKTEKDDFLRSMMWGSLWDSVRFYELAPEDYVKLVIKNINVETDESTIQTLLGRVSTAMNYYLTDAQAKQFAPEIEKLLINKIETAPIGRAKNNLFPRSAKHRLKRTNETAFQRFIKR